MILAKASVFFMAPPVVLTHTKASQSNWMKHMTPFNRGKTLSIGFIACIFTHVTLTALNRFSPNLVFHTKADCW